MKIARCAIQWQVSSDVVYLQMHADTTLLPVLFKRTEWRWGLK